MTLSVKVTGTHDSPLSRFNWGIAAREWARKVEPLIEDAIQRETPVGKGPGAGALRRSVRSDGMKVSAANALLTFSATAPYAGFVVDGTRAHEIRPRSAKALHWLGPDGAVFARLVHHPGTHPNPFPERAITPLLPLIEAALTEAIAGQLKP